MIPKGSVSMSDLPCPGTSAERMNDRNIGKDARRGAAALDLWRPLKTKKAGRGSGLFASA